MIHTYSMLVMPQREINLDPENVFKQIYIHTKKMTHKSLEIYED